MGSDVAVANPERGEIDLVVQRVVDGARKDVHYTLKLTINAAIVFEKTHKKSMGQLLAEASALSFASIRDFIWLLLQKHHKEEFKNLDAVGDLIDDAGGVASFIAKIEDVVKLNQPQPEGEGQTAANPPDAQTSGTGVSSTETPGA